MTTALVPTTAIEDVPPLEHTDPRSIFAWCTAARFTRTQALEAGGFPTNHVTHRVLMDDPLVEREIAIARAHYADKMLASRDDILQELEVAREMAISANNSSAAISASMSKLKVIEGDGLGSDNKIVISWGGESVMADPADLHISKG